VDSATKQLVYKISSNPILNFLKKKNTLLEFDILNLASIVFNIEKASKIGKKIDYIEIPISAHTDTGRDFDRISELLHDLFLYVLIQDIEINFKIVYMKKKRRGYANSFEKCDNVCLFSGGVDSLSGILNSKIHFKNVHGVSVVHGDQTWGSYIVKNLISEISNFEKIQNHMLIGPPMGRFGYSQLRGFLYALYGAIYVSLLDAENLVIAECGPTMYQPQFSSYDSVTMTTHPYVLKTAKEIIEILLKRKINIILPFENMTKAEVIMASPHKELFKHSHSCITLQFGKNEGTCYGCIIRRLGFLTADIEDAIYSYDPIGKNHNVDHLSSVLRFSYDVLFDYNNMASHSKDIIVNYKKRDLFKRFALDNFAALYKYKKRYGKLNPRIQQIYDDAFEQMNEDKLIRRIEKVRRETFKPNFKKVVT